MSISLRKRSTDEFAIVDEKGGSVYFAIREMQNTWRAHDADRNRVSDLTFKSPHDVLAFFEMME
jgi:hypothetical protein